MVFVGYHGLISVVTRTEHAGLIHMAAASRMC